LEPFVDEFRVVEFDQTFSGLPKNSTFNQHYDKVKHYIHNESIWGKYIALALSSPNTEYGKGASHWVREFAQKESIKDALIGIKDEDIVFIGDCDEVWDTKCLKSLNELCNLGIPVKLKLKVYSYYLNNLSSEQFWGTIISKYKDIKNECLNHARSFNCFKSSDCFGWHFTSMGGHENVKKKLTDSYTNESYATSQVLNNLERNINANLDFLGRQFNYTRDESGWPQYLQDNKTRYNFLCLLSNQETG
jgi:hypothetical protein